jgi:hypothetical protein
MLVWGFVVCDSYEDLSFQMMRQHTSFKKRKTTIHVNADTVAGTAHGKKYGYFFRNSEPPKILGNLSAGRASAPPMNGLWLCQYILKTKTSQNTPKCSTAGPGKRKVCPRASQISRISHFSCHALHNANVAIECAIQTTTKYHRKSLALGR